MKVLLLISLFIGSICTQDIEGCLDPNALNCDNNPPTMEEGEYGEWWFHCETCPEVPCEGFYNPSATIDDNSCIYNQVPTWEEMVFTPTFGQIHIDWSAFEPPVDVDDINTFAVQRCLADGTCSFVQGASNVDTFLDDNIVDYYDWTSGENINYYFAIFYANNGWWNQAKGQYNFDLGCTDSSSPNYNPHCTEDCNDEEIIILDYISNSCSECLEDETLDCPDIFVDNGSSGECFADCEGIENINPDENPYAVCEWFIDIYPPNTMVDDGTCETSTDLLGDINEDIILDILDIVLMVNIILDAEYIELADVNEDGIVDILDIVTLVNIILAS